MDSPPQTTGSEVFGARDKEEAQVHQQSNQPAALCFCMFHQSGVPKIASIPTWTIWKRASS